MRDFIAYRPHAHHQDLSAGKNKRSSQSVNSFAVLYVSNSGVTRREREPA